MKKLFLTKNGAQGTKPSTLVRAILVPKARLSKTSAIKIGASWRAFVICIFFLLLAACAKKAEVVPEKHASADTANLPDIESPEEFDDEIMVEDYNASELDDLLEAS